MYMYYIYNTYIIINIYIIISYNKYNSTRFLTNHISLYNTSFICAINI